jgi:uncharacterized protein
MFGMPLGYMIMTGVISLVGMFVSSRLKSKFEKYSQVGLSSRMSGKEIAEAMLRHYGILDVKVQMTQGFLTDHYNPADKTVNLSETVFNGRSVSAAAVAAHECGHAVQHATAYSMLTLRSAVVPFVKVASGAQQFLFMAGLMLISSALGKTILLLTIIAFAITALFSLITLPVEFDASKRALVWLDATGTTRGEEHEGAKDALFWAAMTYVAAALAALVSLIYLVMRYMDSSRN